jgi:DNA-directed RNA polymerase specialized sigma24 family protein
MRAGMKLGTPKLRALKITDADAPLIAKLPKDYQDALAMTGPYETRAVQLGVAIGTVKSRLNRARVALVAARGDKA